MKEWLKHMIELFEEDRIESSIYYALDGKVYLFLDAMDLELQER